MKLTTTLLLILRLKRGGDIPPCTFMVCKGTTAPYMTCCCFVILWHVMSSNHGYWEQQEL